MRRFLGCLSLLESSTRLKVNEQPSILPIVAPENRLLADAAPGVFGVSTEILSLVVLADAVATASSLLVVVPMLCSMCSERLSTSDILRW